MTALTNFATSCCAQRFAIEHAKFDRAVSCCKEEEFAEFFLPPTVHEMHFDVRVMPWYTGSSGVPK
jgi:hypothetical protein